MKLAHLEPNEVRTFVRAKFNEGEITLDRHASVSEINEAMRMLHVLAAQEGLSLLPHATNWAVYDLRDELVERYEQENRALSADAGRNCGWTIATDTWGLATRTVGGFTESWRPLSNGGQAMQIAIAQNLVISISDEVCIARHEDRPGAVVSVEIDKWNDKTLAAHRAIVEWAAMFGREGLE